MVEWRNECMIEWRNRRMSKCTLTAAGSTCGGRRALEAVCSVHEEALAAGRGGRRREGGREGGV